MVLSVLLTLWQWFAAMRFPLHAYMPPSSFAPGVSLLKPLKGVDSETKKCLESWLAQAYTAPTQILFGVASGEDPVCELVRQLIRDHPNADAHLVLCPENLGANPKVSTLIQLERLVRHEVVIVSDADVHVAADFLAQIVSPLRDPGVALVNCFYQLKGVVNLAMRWEAFAVNADFWSQVLQAQMLKPLDFAMGAVMVTRRKQLEQIGGFQALMDYLADDYQLGNRIAGSGGKIVIAPAVVSCLSAPQSTRAVWLHQTRWARTIRACQPVPYFFSILSNATFWPMAWLIASPTWAVAGMAGLSLGLRSVIGAWCERKLSGRVDSASFWLGPAKDMLQVVVWVSAFLGNHITWRGNRYRVGTGGKLIHIGQGE